MSSSEEPQDRTEELKDRVIHTRVPGQLDDEIKRKASRLGLSVSNLVRNILEHTVELVEDVVIDSTRLARSARSNDGRPQPRPRAAGHEAPQHEDVVLGWQRLVLEMNAVCDRCNAILPRGRDAAVAVTDGASAPRFRCIRCIETMTEDGSETKTDGDDDGRARD